MTKPIVNVETGEVTYVERDPAEVAAQEGDLPPTEAEQLAEVQAQLNALLGEE